MPMPAYALSCYGPKCGNLARYKVAARWSDGVTGELKTYALSCPDCLTTLLQRSVEKQRACRLAPGETLEAPGVYEIVRGQRDKELSRRKDLEQLPG
jgi:hypothetical protein